MVPVRSANAEDLLNLRSGPAAGSFPTMEKLESGYECPIVMGVLLEPV